MTATIDLWKTVTMVTRSSLESATFFVCHGEALSWGQALHIILIIWGVGVGNIEKKA